MGPGVEPVWPPVVGVCGISSRPPRSTSSVPGVTFTTHTPAVHVASSTSVQLTHSDTKQGSEALIYGLVRSIRKLNPMFDYKKLQ